MSWLKVIVAFQKTFVTTTANTSACVVYASSNLLAIKGAMSVRYARQMTVIFKRPMLAPLNDPLKYPNYFKDLRGKYPFLASPKLDGIRGVVKSIPTFSFGEDFEMSVTGQTPYKVLSRSMIALPSLQVQRQYSRFFDLDGEFVEGCETEDGLMHRTNSIVMSVDKPSEQLCFRVFDTADDDLLDLPFEERLEVARSAIELTKKRNLELTNVSISLIEHTLCRNEEELLEAEDKALAAGYEGLMFRKPDGYYKHHARATWKEGLIYKLKRFQDGEGIIAGIFEGNKNNNEKVVNEAGYAKRSSAKDGLVASGTTGGFIVDYQGQLINVARGTFTDEELKAIWEMRDTLIGKQLLKFRFFAYGSKNAPRFARAVGFRSEIDL